MNSNPSALDLYLAEFKANQSRRTDELTDLLLGTLDRSLVGHNGKSVNKMNLDEALNEYDLIIKEKEAKGSLPKS